MDDSLASPQQDAVARGGWFERNLRRLSLAVAILALLALCLAFVGDRNEQEAARARPAAEQLRAAFAGLTREAVVAAQNIARFHGASAHVSPEELDAFVTTARVAPAEHVMQLGWAPGEAAGADEPLLLIDRDARAVRAHPRGADHPAVSASIVAIAAAPAGAPSVTAIAPGLAVSDAGRATTAGIVTFLAPTARARPDRWRRLRDDRSGGDRRRAAAGGARGGRGTARGPGRGDAGRARRRGRPQGRLQPARPLRPRGSERRDRRARPRRGRADRD